MTHDPDTGATRVVSDDSRTITIVLYVLSGLGLFTGGLTTIAALIVGLVKKGDTAGTIYASHFDYLNMTNLITIVAGLLFFVLVFLLVGIPLLLLLTVWYIVRLVLGLIKLMKDKPIPNPSSLLF